MRTVDLPGSLKNEGAERERSKCLQLRLPEGGIQMSPAKWYCAKCWISFRSKK